MKNRGMIPILHVCLCLMISWMTMAQAAAPSEIIPEITPRSESMIVNVGKSASIRLTLSPRAVRAKGVTYESDDEQVATVTSRGKVTGVAIGECNIVVTSKYDERTSIKIPVRVIRPAKSITLHLAKGAVKVGETLSLQADFLPEDTSIKQATYKSGNTRIATVDENGFITGVKAGKVTITATAEDGSRARGRLSVQVIQPVVGVTFKTPHARVGVRNSTTLTATVEPKNATNRKMIWESADTSIATVAGTNNRVRVRGIRWGQTVVTGIAEDGGYKASIIVDVGSLRRAVTIRQLSVRNGRPSIQFINNSNLNMVEVRYMMIGYDADGNQIPMGRYSDALCGIYPEPLPPGSYTEYGLFYFLDQVNYPPIDRFSLVITGWTTDTGYYNSAGEFLYDYDISEQNYEWGFSQ